MDRVTLRDTVEQLQLYPKSQPGSSYAYAQAVCQFNALLGEAKLIYLDRADIQALQDYPVPALVDSDVFTNSVNRLRAAIELRPMGSAGETFAQITLPEDAPPDVKRDMTELEAAIALNLHKSALLLAGSIAEALMLARHPDSSDRGPGLSQLVKQARKERLFGKDTLRHLDNLVDYRDLIHPRAEKRNNTIRNEGRVHAAIVALSLLCHELEIGDCVYEGGGRSV